MSPSNPKVNEKIATGVPVGAASQTEGPWSTGLCDCFSDVPGCCLTCWCPCITFGQIAEIVDKGTTPCGVHGALYGLLMLLAGCACCYSCFYRTKMRKQYNIEGSSCGDWWIHCLCEGCALCQEYRELKTRGFDMSFGVGWNENMERQNRGVSMTTPTAPMVESGMKR